MKVDRRLMEVCRERPDEVKELLHSARNEYLVRGEVRRLLVPERHKYSLARGVVKAAIGLGAGAALYFIPGFDKLCSYIAPRDYSLDIFVPLTAACWLGLGGAFWEGANYDRMTGDRERIKLIGKRAEKNIDGKRIVTSDALDCKVNGAWR